MKKFSFFASLMLAAGIFASCSIDDNAIDFKEDTVIEHEGTQYTVGVVATLIGTPGQEVSVTAGTYADYDIYGVDFGDGEIITDSVFKTNTKLTTFTSTVKGEGLITVYGNSSVWYLGLSGQAVPTSYDQRKLVRIQQLVMSNMALDELNVDALDSLRLLSFNNGQVNSINVTGNALLSNLTIKNDPTYEGPANPLAAIDLSQNAELAELIINGSSAELPGNLTSIDLSNNSKLNSVQLNNQKLANVVLPTNQVPANGKGFWDFWAQNNQLTAVDFSKSAQVRNVHLENNKLTSVIFTDVKSNAAIYVSDNELTSLVVPGAVKTIEAQNNELESISIVDATSTLKVDNNHLTFSKLPAISGKTYTYEGQEATIEIALPFKQLDLTVEGKATKVKDEAATPSTFTFKSVDGDKVLVEGDDIKTDEPGKFTFLRVNDAIYGVITNDAFPGLEFKTTEFAITTEGAKPVGGGEAIFALNEGDVYTSGQSANVNGVATITFGEEGGADFGAAAANGSVEGYTAFSNGNGTNGNKAGGTFYTIKTEKEGTIEVAVVLNAGKSFYIEEDGTALADYNGISVDTKYYGTFKFDVKAGSSYKIYCAGSKLGFYGFKFIYK
jgi:hypothetical protein